MKLIMYVVFSAWAASSLVGCTDDNNSSGASHASFAYTGDTGPGFWAELDEANASCLTDTRQSPIDITHPVADGSLTALVLDLHETAIHMINNGHTLELEYHEGSTLTLGGVAYDLLQFHFHTLSEHAINGERGAMELHAVFKDVTTGKLAVMGMLFNVGAENAFLAELIGHLPTKSGEVDESEAEINLADALTDTSAYYTYDGSLTTPPCSPIVTWIVLKNAATLSSTQFDAFREITGNNFRPLQDRNGREVRATP